VPRRRPSASETSADANGVSKTSADASGERSVAIGGDAADVTIITGDTYQLALRRRFLISASLVAVVLVLGAAVAIYQFAQTRASVPTRMTGNVKVAVAQFGVAPRGSQAELERSNALATAVYTRLDEQFKSLTTGATPLSVQVWPPNSTGQIPGASREERASAAARRASEIGADVILYGNVDLAETSTGFTPEFYLAESSLKGAEELAGWYGLGPRIDAGRDFLKNPATFERLLASTLARTRPLPPFLYGRGFFQNDGFLDADQYFELAAEGWPDDAGKEVLYLFRGNVAGQVAAHAAPEARADWFARARAYYDQALQLNADYARAQLGSAEVLFQVYGAQRDCAAEQVDAAQLERTMQVYQRALDATDHPPHATIRAKAHLGRGRAALCLSQAEVADRWTQAELDLQAVLTEFNASDADGRERLQPLAAQAHGSLAIVYWPLESDPSPHESYARVAAELEQAAALTQDPAYRSFTLRLLEDVQKRTQ
jgi:hypothetical protein